MSEAVRLRCPFDAKEARDGACRVDHPPERTSRLTCSKSRSRGRWAGCWALAALAAVFVSAGGAANPAAATVKPKGKALGAAHVAWWQWALSLPLSTHPLNPDANMTCATGQVGKQWYIRPSRRTLAAPLRAIAQCRRARSWSSPLPISRVQRWSRSRSTEPTSRRYGPAPPVSSTRKAPSSRTPVRDTRRPVTRGEARPLAAIRILGAEHLRQHPLLRAKLHRDGGYRRGRRLPAATAPASGRKPHPAYRRHVPRLRLRARHHLQHHSRATRPLASTADIGRRPNGKHQQPTTPAQDQIRRARQRTSALASLLHP